MMLYMTHDQNRIQEGLGENIKIKFAGTHPIMNGRQLATPEIKIYAK
jgi:hypothetical protein